MTKLWSGKLAGKIVKTEKVEGSDEVLITVKVHPIAAQRIFERMKVVINGMLEWTITSDHADFKVFADAFELTEEERGE
jgi:hypothetical protein